MHICIVYCTFTHTLKYIRLINKYLIIIYIQDIISKYICLTIIIYNKNVAYKPYYHCIITIYIYLSCGFTISFIQ